MAATAPVTKEEKELFADSLYTAMSLASAKERSRSPKGSLLAFYRMDERIGDRVSAGRHYRTSGYSQQRTLSHGRNDQPSGNRWYLHPPKRIKVFTPDRRPY